MTSLLPTQTTYQLDADYLPLPTDDGKPWLMRIQGSRYVGTHREYDKTKYLRFRTRWGAKQWAKRFARSNRVRDGFTVS